MKNGKPDKPLLPASVIARDGKTNSWHEIDVEKYGVQFPKEGVVIAMEWLYNDDPSYLYDIDNRPTNMPPHCFGQVLSTSKEFEIGYYWDRENNGKWHMFKNTTNNKPYNPMIKAEIAYYD